MAVPDSPDRLSGSALVPLPDSASVVVAAAAETGEVAVPTPTRKEGAAE